MNILIPEEFVAGEEVFAKIRSGGNPSECRIIEVTDDSVTVKYNKPQFAPTPGQRIVLYNDSDYVIAGGTITSDVSSS
jgi:tRNA-specific 2-thiouridylase